MMPEICYIYCYFKKNVTPAIATVHYMAFFVLNIRLPDEDKNA